MAGLLGKLEKRPVLSVAMGGPGLLSRGMKVRSSVKKLCDGCKVRLYPSRSIAQHPPLAWSGVGG